DQLLLSDEEFVRLIDRLINTFYYSTNHALLELGFPYAKDSYLHKKWRDKMEINITTCEGGRNSLTISVDGRVTPCVCFESEDFYFGDIKSETLLDLWNAEFLGYFRGEHKHGRCDSCDIWSDCLGGCKAMALLETGRIDSSDPSCVFWKRTP
ncbi:SPASM domain-containing protein, partial [Deltaproteobacteria bacterium]|nr:SPASM domain-containing protein [Deltaproteobacteria bacterium]